VNEKKLRAAVVRIWAKSMDTPAYDFGTRLLIRLNAGATLGELHAFAKANPPCEARGHRGGCPRYCPSNQSR
jgi:hypothetical protein